MAWTRRRSIVEVNCSMILKPLQKIQIIESIKMCKAGSIGYFVAQDSMGSHNAWDICIVFTRFGKAGKPRLDVVPLNISMIDYNTMDKTDKNIIDIAKYYNDLEPRPYIHRGIEHSPRIGTSTIMPISMDTKNLLELSDNEFTAYIIALSMFIHKIVHQKSSRYLHRTPGIKFVNFTADEYNLMAAKAEYIGYYILHGLKLDTDRRKNGSAEKYQLFSEIYARQIDSKIKKRALLSKLYMALAMSKNTFRYYNTTTDRSFSNISTKITDILRYYKRNKHDLSQIKEVEENRMVGRKIAVKPTKSRKKWRISP